MMYMLFDDADDVYVVCNADDVYVVCNADDVYVVCKQTLHVV